MNQSDKKDWQDFCRGDQNALNRIYERHKDSMFTYCIYLSNDRHLSEEIIQDSFTKLIEQKNKIHKIDSIKNWLFICCRNLMFNQLKKIKQYNSETSSIVISNKTETDFEIKEFIEKVLFKLSPDERDLILLREYQAFPIKEMAQMLKITEESVRVKLFRIRKKMQLIGKAIL